MEGPPQRARAGGRIAYTEGMLVSRCPDMGLGHPTLILLSSLAALLAAVAAPAQDVDGAGEFVPNPAGIVLQRQHAEAFVGGEEVVVQVTIAAPSDTKLFALGLYETPPSGWSFEGMYVDAGPAPDILPPLGATGVLEFGWVSPAVPVRLRYALRVPPQDEGSRFLTGQVEYRLESDPRRNSAPVLTQLSGVANEAPVVTLLGEARLAWPLGQVFVDPGATASDKEDGDLSDRVEVAGLVDTGQPGTYTLSYGVMDSAGNRAEPVFREVEVVATDGGTPGNPGDDGGGDGGGGGGNRSDGAGAGATMRTARAADAPGAEPGLIVPEIALGDGRPGHTLPHGRPGDGSESALPDGGDRRAAGVAIGADRMSRLAGDGVGRTMPAAENGVSESLSGSGGSPVPRVFIAVAVVLLAAGGTAGWRVFRTGPQYRRRVR